MEIADWLRALSLERYAETFSNNAIDLAVLPELSESDLEKLGVLLGHRKIMLRAIAALRGGAAETLRSLCRLVPRRFCNLSKQGGLYSTPDLTRLSCS